MVQFLEVGDVNVEETTPVRRSRIDSCMAKVGLKAHDDEYIKRVDEKTADLLIQPYITPLKQFLRILYYVTWTLITSALLAAGEMYVSTNLHYF